MTGSVVRPVKKLKAFQKVDLRADEEKQVTFHLTRTDLKFYTKEMLFKEQPGECIVFVGPSVKETLEAAFELR